MEKEYLSLALEHRDIINMRACICWGVPAVIQERIYLCEVNQGQKMDWVLTSLFSHLKQLCPDVATPGLPRHVIHLTS